MTIGADAEEDQREMTEEEGVGVPGVVGDLWLPKRLIVFRDQEMIAGMIIDAVMMMRMVTIEEGTIAAMEEEEGDLVEEET